MSYKYIVLENPKGNKIVRYDLIAQLLEVLPEQRREKLEKHYGEYKTIVFIFDNHDEFNPIQNNVLRRGYSSFYTLTPINNILKQLEKK